MSGSAIISDASRGRLAGKTKFDELMRKFASAMSRQPPPIHRARLPLLPIYDTNTTAYNQRLQRVELLHATYRYISKITSTDHHARQSTRYLKLPFDWLNCTRHIEAADRFEKVYGTEERKKTINLQIIDRLKACQVFSRLLPDDMWSYFSSRDSISID